MILRKSYYLFFALVSLLFISLDIRYAFHAWFFQDDLGFLWKYSHSLYWGEIIHRENDLGRFITQNLYWHVLYAVFGKNPVGYFLVNLGLIILNAVLLFYFIDRQLQQRFLALVSAVSYLASHPVLQNYSWLSDSQHIIAHTFIFLFFICALNPRYSLWSIPLYLLGIYSNELMIFALPPVLAYWFLTKEYNKWVAVFLAVLAIVFLMLSLQMVSGGHQIDVSFSRVWNNAFYYFGPILSRLLLPFWLWAFYTAFKNNDKFLVFLTVAAISFYLPFAFLKYANSMSYFSMSYIFNMVIVFYFLKKWPWIALIIFLIPTVKAYHRLTDLNVHPLGVNSRAFVEAVRLLHIPPAGMTVCFKPLDILKNTTEDPGANIPAFWRMSGFGDAFKTFVSPDNHYVLFSTPHVCDKVITVNDSSQTPSYDYPQIVRVK